MKRALLFVSALAPLASVVLACAPRERIIVVHDSTAAVPVAQPVKSDPTEASSAPVAKDVLANETSGGEPAAREDREDRQGQDWGLRTPDTTELYGRVVDKVEGMVSDSDLQHRVGARRLALVNVAWEDTGRAQGSSVGPNISDLTLEVRRHDARSGRRASLMPVIRPPNFVDRTGDVPEGRFFVRVGNERNGSLRSVPLTDVLRDIRAFASHPESVLGSGNLLAPRDSHFLVSAQAVFLPIPRTGKAEFNPVLFNYQSAPGAPAVLSILVTRQGASMQVVENRPEDATAAGWGQELYFNNKGQRAALTAERKSDVEERIAAQGGPKSDDDRSALQKGADVLFLVQVPLRHTSVPRFGTMPLADDAIPSAKGAGGAAKPSMAPAPAAPARRAEQSDVEQAVLGHGRNQGLFREGGGLRLERDPRFPVRVTVQFYKATSNGVVSDIDLDSIARSIGSVYEHAEFVGSLVLPDGDPRRPTAWQNVPREWFPW